MRVTFSQSFRNAASDTNLAAEQLAAAQRQVSSGKRINKPSDDPAGANSAIAGHAAIGAIDAYTQTADSTTSRLTVVDSMLSDIINKITAAQTAAASARGSVTSQSQRDAAAANLQGISDALLADFNAQFHGSYLFSGSKATTSPYKLVAGTVSSYQGNATPVSVDLGQGRTAQTSFDGSTIAQGSDPSSIFTVLSNLVTAAKSGDNVGLGQGLDALERALSRTTLAQTQVGSSFAALDDVRARLNTERVGITAQLSITEDANMASAITNMSQADTAYRAALAAFGRIGSVSLMDYLK
ncbi:MAG: flagellin [Acidobacteriota bacterium]